MTDKESLKARKAELEKELDSIRKVLKDFELNEKKEKYGDDMKCKNCRYDVVQNFSDDGWHNCCGNDDTYACTCCHSYCEYFEPDNEITKFIKENVKYGYIYNEHYEGIKSLAGDIFTITNPSVVEKVIDILKITVPLKEEDIDV